jgi:hypothetical protein
MNHLILKIQSNNEDFDICTTFICFSVYCNFFHQFLYYINYMKISKFVINSYYISYSSTPIRDFKKKNYMKIN